MIVKAVSESLQIKKNDFLLDLCCGNGALSRYFFDQCSGGLGVDFSEALIDVAEQNFQVLPHRAYVLDDVVAFTQNTVLAERFTKILCYGSFAYLEKEAANALLRNCFNTFTNAHRLFIGNCPDKDQIKDFFRMDDYVPGIEDEPDSAIGIWRTKDEFKAMAESTGWRAEFTSMPENFYAAKYRYDVILSREW